MVFTIVEDLPHFKQCLTKDSDLIICYFTASWCGPCKIISPIVNEIGEKNDHLQVLKIDVDDCDDVSDECQIKCMPTFKFYKPNKMEPIHEFSGADSNELVNTIEMLLKKVDFNEDSMNNENF